MAERLGVHRLLQIPQVYNFVQSLFFHEESHRLWKQLVRGHRNGAVLDVGCGPGNKSLYFREARTYIGVDVSEDYVTTARRLFGDFGHFYVLSATDIDQLDPAGFDLVLLSGVLHHLTDLEVESFLTKVRGKLNSGGNLVTIDPTYVEGRTLANFVVSQDRGLHVRSPGEVLALTEKHLVTLNLNVVEQRFPPYQRLLLRLGPKR